MGILCTILTTFQLLCMSDTMLKKKLKPRPPNPYTLILLKNVKFDFFTVIVTLKLENFM